MVHRLTLALVLAAGCVLEGGADADSSTSGATTTGADGSSSAGESTTGDTYAGQCDQIPTVVVDPDQVGITGISAREALVQAEGVYTGTIVWTADTPANYLGSTEPSALTLEIRYDGGEIRDVDAVLVHPCEHDGPCPCEDSLEIDVTWRLVSADGVLDESWTAPLVHQPNSWYMANPLGISHDFQPDDAAGSLGAASFDLGDSVLRRLVAQAELGDGAAQGSISTEIEMLGGIGFGPAANFAAVRAIDGGACNALRGEQPCGWAGCTAVTGQRVYSTPPSCGCNDPEGFCFAAPLGGEPVATLYTREIADAFESWNEVVAFPTLADPPPSPWRLCADAPEVPECACPATCQ